MKKNKCIANEKINEDIIIDPISFMSEEENMHLLSIIKKRIRENYLKDNWIKFEDFVSENRKKYNL